MNQDTVLIGVVLIVLGILTGWFFCLGFILVIAGVIVLIIGVTQEDRRPPVQYVYPMQPNQAGMQQIGQPATMSFCPYCGSQVAPGMTVCPRCGAQLPRK